MSRWILDGRKFANSGCSWLGFEDMQVCLLQRRSDCVELGHMAVAFSRPKALLGSIQFPRSTSQATQDKSFVSPPLWWISYLMTRFQVTSLTQEWVQLCNTSLTRITIVFTTIKEQVIFNRDFAVKNFAGTEIRTRNLSTRFFFVAASPSIQAQASSRSHTVGLFKQPVLWETQQRVLQPLFKL